MKISLHTNLLKFICLYCIYCIYVLRLELFLDSLYAAICFIFLLICLHVVEF